MAETMERAGTALPAVGGTSLAASLLPMATVVFVIFFVIGMAMPVLPLHVHDRLAQGAFVVGLVAGGQFSASLVSRLWAGRYTDRHGGKRSMAIGLVVAAAAGLVYLLSLHFVGTPGLSVAILVAGRAVLGVAESFVITGALGWGLAVGGPANSGKVIAWMGMPMYAAFALGAPTGSAIYATYGFQGIAMATVLAPLLAFLPILRAPAVNPGIPGRASLRVVFHAIKLPGLGLALASLGFGSVTIFVALLFAQRGWPSAWGAFTALSVAFILARILFGHLPDRRGGATVALVSLLVEAAGQAMMWLAPWPAFAFVGAALTGFGYSLVFPAFGVEAIRRAPPESRALAMGAYTACLDLALGVGGPALGALAGLTGVAAVFLASALLVLAACFVAVRLKGAR